MDQDGANPSYLTNGDYIVMTPRFSSTSQEITYMALRPERLGDLPVQHRDRPPGEPRRLPGHGVRAALLAGRRQGGLLGRARRQQRHLRDGPAQPRRRTRLTTDPAIDTSPSFSPDGVADRLQLRPRRLAAALCDGRRRLGRAADLLRRGRYTTPVWSPTGEFIAFTKQTGGEFHIGVMKPDGSDERILTTSYLDEGPTWAPNGRVLMFSRETPGGAPKLVDAWTSPDASCSRCPIPAPDRTRPGRRCLN